jgi:hypothetical protein
MTHDLTPYILVIKLMVIAGLLIYSVSRLVIGAARVVAVSVLLHVDVVINCNNLIL